MIKGTEKVAKGTVCAISGDIPFKDRHHGFTTVPFKPLIDHRGQRSLKFCAKSRKMGMFASVQCDNLRRDDVTFIPEKSRIFFIQRGFQS